MKQYHFFQVKKIILVVAIITISAFSIVRAASLPISKASADIGVVNKTRIIYWLEQHGKLKRNASKVEKEVALSAYLAKKNFTRNALKGAIGNKVRLAEQGVFAPRNDLKAFPKELLKVSSTSSQITKSARVTSTVKVLAIMIDFPDLKYNDNGLTASDTDMFYDDYSTEHYNQLLFSATGYAAPSGEIIESAYQYYQQESGGSLTFSGVAQGWVTADNNADYYGGNDVNNDDKNPSALILEAVTKAVAELNVDLTEYDQTDLFDIDGDGIINEPDGIIDHVMVFHSSIGEESGGGSLAEDAIWSHRFFVFDSNNQPVDVPGSTVKLFGYTITPIDAASGVVVHEFGHDLGVPDEYDTENGLFGSPVSDWSLMSSGSWLGFPAGSRPGGFSPYAKDYFQTRYEGNWINQQEITLSNLTTETIALDTATEHQAGINQVKINLPVSQIDFGAPYTGDKQFYSQHIDETDSSMSFDVTLPAGTSILSMKARWNIELDYDYVQVLVDGDAILGNHTRETNQYYNTVSNFITDDSLNISGAEGTLGWVDLIFDLSAYENQTVTIKISYVTDQAVGGYGFVADDIKVVNDNTELVNYGAEDLTGISLAGFVQVGATRDGGAHNYYIQLRSHTATDSALSRVDYDAGMLIWYRNDGVSDNQVNQHPGEVFIGVIDADQVAIKQSVFLKNTAGQIRDAAFSLFDQSSANNDTHLMANSKFDDFQDYSSPYQPESGIKLPKLGLSITLDSQAIDSTTASITLVNAPIAYIERIHNGLMVSFSIEDTEQLVNSTYLWQFGDNTSSVEASISHTYNQAGVYTVTVTYQTSSGDRTLTYDIVVGTPVIGSITANIADKKVDFSSSLSGGEGSYIYRWDFGDGSNIKQSLDTTHTYENSGTYQVTLSVFDDTLQTFTFTQTIVIDNALTANFSYLRDNLTVNFNESVSGGTAPYSFVWDFGDNSTSTSASPSHTYDSAGSYTVKLTVTDASGVESVFSDTVIAIAAVVTPVVTPPSSGGGGSFGMGLMLVLFLVVTKSNTRYKQC